jgi:hypothetical protein
MRNLAMTSANYVGATLALGLSIISCSSAEPATSVNANSGGTQGLARTSTSQQGGAISQSGVGGAQATGGMASVASVGTSPPSVGGTTTVGGSASSTSSTRSSANGGASAGGTSAAGSSSIAKGGGGTSASGGSSSPNSVAAGGGSKAGGGVSSGGRASSAAGGPGFGGTKTTTGSTSTAGGAGAGGAGAGGDTSGTVECTTESAVITYPTLPGASVSPLYTVTANGVSQFVEKLGKFSPEMAVHFAAFSVAKGCTANISVTVKESFSAFTLSPKSRKISATKNGNAISFASGPNYLILKVDSKDLLFILIDEQESNPPKIGDANVKSIAEYNVDNTGATLETSKIQSAINAASGATQNILYFPPGRYKVGELSMKSNMTLYLAAGSILDGSTNTGDYNAAGPAVENTTHSVLHMNDITNATVLGRGVIDGNGSVIRGSSNDTPSVKIDVMRIDQSTKIVVDGILVRDSVFWNTLIYNSDQVTIRNYKVINRRPTTTTYNQTDGIDFDCSSNGSVFNAFVYSGDDSLSPKREEEGKIDTNNIVYEKVVAYTNSAATKVGTKTFGKTMDTLTFKNIDVVKAGRAMVIDANDTAAIKNIKWEDIRIEAADSNVIDIEEDRAPDWRTAPNTSTVKDAYFTNVSSDVRQLMNIHGKSSSVNVNGVHFSNFTVQGKKLSSSSDSAALWNINQYVSNITFE